MRKTVQNRTFQDVNNSDRYRNGSGIYSRTQGSEIKAAFLEELAPEVSHQWKSRSEHQRHPT